jgi:hypothetical protein
VWPIGAIRPPPPFRGDGAVPIDHEAVHFHAGRRNRLEEGQYRCGIDIHVGGRRAPQAVERCGRRASCGERGDAASGKLYESSTADDGKISSR